MQNMCMFRSLYWLLCHEKIWVEKPKENFPTEATGNTKKSSKDTSDLGKTNETNSKKIGEQNTELDKQETHLAKTQKLISRQKQIQTKIIFQKV